MRRHFPALEKLLKVKNAPSPEERALFEKTQDFIRWVRWIPGLRMIAVSNSLAMYATHTDSDIDLFIITAPNRLWVVRSTILIIAKILGVRAKPGDEAGKFCFPFFITEKHLNLKPIAIKNDVYLEYWMQTLKPILIRNYSYGRLLRVNGIRLSDDEYTNSLEFLLHENWNIRGNPILDYFLNHLDNFFRVISLPHIYESIQKNGPPGIGIRLDDEILKLHYTDRREEMRGKISWL